MNNINYKIGDICFYSFDNENKSRAIIEIVDVVNECGVAKIKFHKVFVDDTEKGFFDYLFDYFCRTKETTLASLKHLKIINHEEYLEMLEAEND